MRIIEAFRGKREEMNTDSPYPTPESAHDVLVEKLLEDLKSGFITEYFTDPPAEDDEFLWRRRLSVVLKKRRKKFLVKLDKYLPNGSGYLNVEDYIPEMTKPNYDTVFREMRINEDEFWCVEVDQSKTTYRNGSEHLDWSEKGMLPENARKFSRDVLQAQVDETATKQYFDLCRRSADPDTSLRWPHFEDRGER